VGLGLFTSLLLCHNFFAACQDVGIDALATEVLPEDERGQANGLMFGAAQIGMAIGGSGVIALKGRVDFGHAALIVPAALSLIMGTVLAGLKEAPSAGRASGVDGALQEIKDYGLTVLRAFFTTRRGLLAMVLALLPAGAMSLSLTVSNVITPTLGMSDDEIARLGATCSVIFAVACVVGGYISDRWGRRRSLGLFAGAMVLPTLWMAWRFSEAGWQSAPEGQDGVWPRHEELIAAWTGASYVYAVFMGLMYGVRSALYMDVADPRVAATQFTASMALLNLVTMYSYWWQGQALTPAEKGGWGLSLAQTMGMDAALGLVFLFILPFLAPLPRAEAQKG
jgi:MFS family permease